MNVGPLNFINGIHNGHKTRCWQQQRRHNIDGLRPKEVTTKWINIFISLHSACAFSQQMKCNARPERMPTTLVIWKLISLVHFMQKIERFERRWHRRPVCAISLLPFSALLITITMRRQRRRRQCILMRKLFGDDVEVWPGTMCNRWFLSKSWNEQNARRTLCKKFDCILWTFFGSWIERFGSFWPAKCNMAIKSLEKCVYGARHSILCRWLDVHDNGKTISCSLSFHRRTWYTTSMAVHACNSKSTVTILASKGNAFRLYSFVALCSISLFRGTDAQYAYAFMLTASFVTRWRRRKRCNL